MTDPTAPFEPSGWWQASDGRWYPDSSPPGPGPAAAPADADRTPDRTPGRTPGRSYRDSAPPGPGPAAAPMHGGGPPGGPPTHQPYAPPTFQPMAPPASWGGPPVPHRPPEKPAPPNRTAVVAALGVVAVVVLAVGALVTFSGDAPPDRASPSTGDLAPSTEATPLPPTSQVVDDDLLSTLNVQKNDIGSSWQQVDAEPLGQGADGCRVPATGVVAGHTVSYVLNPNGVSGTVRAHLTAMTTVFVDDQAAVAQEGIDGSDAHGECLRVDSEDRWSVASSGTSPPGAIARQETGVTPPSLGWRYRTTFTGQTGRELVAYTDVVIVRRGRVRLALTMLSLDVPFDPALKQLLIDRVAERVAATIKAAD